MSTIDPDPNHEPEPTPQLTAIEQALRAAGAEITKSFADVGLRVVATTALGQVLAGLPDAAKGMIDALKPEQQYALFEAVTTLQNIALDATPEGKTANRDHEQTSDFDARTYTLAGIYRYAMHGRRDKVISDVRALDHAEVQLMYRSARALLTVLDEHLPQTERHGEAL